MAGNVANRTVRITYEFAQKNAQVAQNVNKLVKGTTHNFKGLSHQMVQSDSAMSKIVNSFKSFHMELLGLGFGFAMIGMIFSQFVTKALNEYMKLTKWGDALGMSWLNMQGAIKTLGYHIVSFAEDTLKSLFDGVEKAINWFMDFDTSVGGAASSMLVLVGAAALVLSPLAFFGLFLFSIGQLIVKLVGMIGWLSTSLGAAGLKGSLVALGKVFVVFSAVVWAGAAILGMFNLATGKNEEETDAWGASLKVLTKIFFGLEFAIGMAVAGIALLGFSIGETLGKIFRIFMSWLDLYGKFTSTIVSGLAVAIDAWNAYWRAVQGGGVDTSRLMQSSAAFVGNIKSLKPAFEAAIKETTNWSDVWAEIDYDMTKALGKGTAFGEMLEKTGQEALGLKEGWWTNKWREATPPMPAPIIDWGTKGAQSAEDFLKLGNKAATMSQNYSKDLTVALGVQQDFGKELELSTENMNDYTETIQQLFDKMEISTEGMNDFADSLFGVTENAGAANAQLSQLATTGLPGGMPGLTLPSYPQELADFLNEGISVSNEILITIDDNTSGNISVRSEVLSADEKSSTTLNQLGVRA